MGVGEAVAEKELPVGNAWLDVITGELEDIAELGLDIADDEMSPVVDVNISEIVDIIIIDDELALDISGAGFELDITIPGLELESITGALELGITVPGLEVGCIVPGLEAVAMLFPAVGIAKEELGGFAFAATSSGGTTAPTAPGT